jgi:Dockerin type I domain
MDCMNRPTALLSLALLLVATAAQAYVPNSGDVDDDGKLTIRDAVMIWNAQSWPELPSLTAFRQACDYNRDGECDLLDMTAILQTVVTDYNDWDGDGVPNDRDCDSFDERISSPHTYYVDLDQDSYGDDHNVIQACTVTPPPLTVAWGGDPDDLSPFAVPLVVPKGDRILGLDFGDTAESQRWRPDLAKELGAEAATLRLQWSFLETAPNTFGGGQVQALQIANCRYAPEGFALSLSITPFSDQYLTVPEDLKAGLENGSTRFSDPAVIERFRNLLTFVHGQLPGVRLSSLQIGDDVDTFLSRSPAFVWADFSVFYQAVSAHAKTLWGPGLKVGFTATREGLVTEPTRSLLLALNSLVDVVDVSYLPISAAYLSIEPSQVKSDVEEILALYYPKPIYFQAVGYPSAPINASSETKQSQFLRAFFAVWDTYSAQIPFAAFSRLQDWSASRAQFQAVGVGGASTPIQAGYFRSLGLRTFDGEGNRKAGYQTLRNLSFERGWWRNDPLPSRSFGMGFTPALYDFPDDPASYIAMLDWLAQTITRDGTMENLHLDIGVPWVEALADTFSTPDLPYSGSLKEMWAGLRSRVPANHKLLVSLNPLGVPRNVIAPYFGVGQGFTYSDTFVRVGDGIVKDAENRMPPAPWDTYRLNDPHVKQAFLNYCRRALDFFHPDYLVMAIEVTATMNEDPAAYADLLELLKHVHDGLKADPAYAPVTLMVSLSATTFMVDEYGVPFKHEDQGPRKRELQVQGFLDVLPYVDAIGLSLYPHYGKYSSNTMPAMMYDGLFPMLAASGKPVAVTESGFPAVPYSVLGTPFITDTDKQDRFYRLLFAEAEKTTAPFEFIVSYSPRDSDLGWERLLQGSLENPPTVSPRFVEFYKYFKSIGVYDGAGNERAATRTWKDELALPYGPK